MKISYLGEVVRQRREQLALSLEMVSEGLCTAMTLSRFENGQQTPSWDCVTAILQRLGLPDDQYYAQLTRRETRLIRLRKEALAYCSQFEISLGEAKQQARAQALKKLRDLERCVKDDDRINQQFILRIYATVEAYPPKKQLEMLMEAIRLTAPRFDPNELSSCLYCENEIIIISKIAIRHSLCGQRGKAVDIYRQLLQLLLERSPDYNCLPLIMYNYALQLALEKREEEALDVSELGRQTCIKQGFYYAIPRFLHIEADCCHTLGELDKSEALYRSAYYIYGATMDIRNRADLEMDAKERFGMVF